jgi:predicted RNase H-like HicB family nuclease
MDKAFAVQGLPVQFIKQGKYIVAYSSALDISTAGKNLSEAKKRFTEIVKIFFEELMEAGTAHDVLSELGWTRQSKTSNWLPPRIHTQSVDVRIPVVA